MHGTKTPKSEEILQQYLFEKNANRRDSINQSCHQILRRNTAKQKQVVHPSVRNSWEEEKKHTHTTKDARKTDVCSLVSWSARQTLLKNTKKKTHKAHTNRHTHTHQH